MCGTRGVVYNWLSSYIKKNSQFVYVDNVKSGLLNILCGELQGSILGPKLLFIYINDLHNGSTLVKNYFIC